MAHLRVHHIDWVSAAHETPDPMAFYIALICKLEFHVDDETLLQIVADAQKYARSSGEPKGEGKQ